MDRLWLVIAFVALVGCGDDGSETDGGGADAGLRDGGGDGGSVDAGALDAGPRDAGALDGGGTTDAGPADAAPGDAGLDAEVAALDAGVDAHVPALDAGFDAGMPMPRMVAATYLGDPGSSNPSANQSARNALWSSAGDLVVSGLGGEGAPTTPGAYQRAYAGNGGWALGGDCWIGRLSDDLSTLNAATLYGGPGEERPCYGLGELPSGEIVVGGHTGSDTGIATPGAFDSTRDGGTATAFVAVLSADLRTRIAGTYLGGPGTLRGGVRVLSSGDILAHGQVDSGGVTTAGALQGSTAGGLNEAWIGALSPDLGALRWGTFLGSNSGMATEVIIAAHELPSGNIVFHSSSPGRDWLNGMRTTGAVAAPGEGNRPFIAELVLGATQSLAWLSVLGPADGASQAGVSFQEPGIAVSATGDVAVVGEAGASMGTSGTLRANLSGGGDCYVCRAGSSGSIQWCTHVGGPGYDRCTAPSFAAGGQLLVGGTTDDPGFCAGADATLNATHGGGDDAFLAVLSADGTRMPWCTLLGGSGDEVGRWVTRRADGRVALTGMTQSADFPATAGAYDPSYNGNEDMFVAVYADIPYF